MFKKSFLLKIPKNINIYIYPLKNYLLFKSFDNKKLIKINSDIFKIKKGINTVSLTVDFFKTRKKLIKKQKEILLLLRRTLIEVSSKKVIKLKLQGIGYKMVIIEHELGDIIHLKLGYSHSLYFKLPFDVTATISKSNILFLFGNSNLKLALVAALIKNCKKPDPYKGKGILYVEEKINFKIGKKS